MAGSWDPHRSWEITTFSPSLFWNSSQKISWLSAQVNYNRSSSACCLTASLQFRVLFPCDLIIDRAVERNNLSTRQNQLIFLRDSGWIVHWSLRIIGCIWLVWTSQLVELILSFRVYSLFMVGPRLVLAEPHLRKMNAVRNEKRNRMNPSSITLNKAGISAMPLQLQHRPPSLIVLNAQIQLQQSVKLKLFL
ncbi:Hypothetical_protein [Hexamita inflata]|uniref:Hypothetical_protein n=1 Tax=Hexamita inflata TaxID=28002 RepID=A0AA86PPD1_9EUKA|nr:Hypothetical protein HINF_LOCUS31354 [Hexamita inflata]